MSVLSLTELSAPDAIAAYQRQIIEANRRMAEQGIARIDYRHDPDRAIDRMRRAIERMEDRG